MDHVSPVLCCCVLVVAAVEAVLVAGRTPSKHSFVEEVEEIVEGKLQVTPKKLEFGNHPKELGATVGKSDENHPKDSDATVGKSNETPAEVEVVSLDKEAVSGGKRNFEEVDEVGEPCAPGVGHVWHEFSKGSYVNKGFLSGEKRCIGRHKDDSLCNRSFVPKSIQLEIENGDTKIKSVVHETATVFHPTMTRPAYGCTQCFHAMCFDCHDHYEAYERNSPGKKGRPARATTWKTVAKKGGESGCEE
jgi:hypothetical protein